MSHQSKLRIRVLLQFTQFRPVALAAIAVGIAACGDGGGGATNKVDAAADLAADTLTSPDPGVDAPFADARDGSDARAVDLSTEVALDSGTDASDASLTLCNSGLSGTSPFGSALSGKASFADIFSGTKPLIDGTVVANIYFPAGRVAGAPVQLSIQSPAITDQYFFGPSVTLADDLSATGLTVGGHNVTITASLLPGAGGLQATVTKNFANPGGDVADTRTGSMLMCPGGDVPAPSMQISAVVASPLSTFSVNATTPIATSALEDLQIRSPQGAVAIKVSMNGSSMFATGPNFTISGSSAYPPGQPLSFDASLVRDVLGRAVPLTLGGTAVLATTAALSDLTFATAPPTGALACSGAPACTPSMFPMLDATVPSGMSRCTGGGSAANGVLTIGTGVTGNPNVDGLLALPVTSATKLRVRASVGDAPGAGSCISKNSSASMNWAAMVVVGPNGEASSRVILACDGTMADAVIDLPSASPLWLAVHVEGVTRVPYMSPVPGPPSVFIDELELM